MPPVASRTCQVFAGGVNVATSCFNVCQVFAWVNVCYRLLQGLVRVGGNIVPKISFMSIYFLYIN